MADHRSRLASAARGLSQAREHRDRLIIEASEAGLSRREVARAVGLSPAGIQHILRRRRDGAGPGS